MGQPENSSLWTNFHGTYVIMYYRVRFVSGKFAHSIQVHISNRRDKVYFHSTKFSNTYTYHTNLQFFQNTKCALNLQNRNSVFDKVETSEIILSNQVRPQINKICEVQNSWKPTIWSLIVLLSRSTVRIFCKVHCFLLDMSLR